MKSDMIFCPKCNTLLLEAPQCPKCGWKRPARPPGEDKRLLWETRYMEGISSGLTWARGLLFFLDGQGRLHALDAASREKAWDDPVELGHWRVHEQVAVDDDLVVLGTMEDAPLPEADKVVLALDLETGQERWRQTLHERQISDPNIADGKVFVATSSNQATALAREDGDILWQAPIAGIYMAAPAVFENLVFFGGDKGIITALHQDSGAKAWTYRVDAFGSWPESIPYTPAVVDGVLYFTCWNRKTYALDARSGEVIWISEPTQKRPPMTPPLVTEDTLYFAAHDRYVYALDRATGKEIWRTQLPRRSEVQPLLVDGVLYVAARDHHVYALDATTGEVQEAPALTTGGKVFKAWAFDGETLYLADDLGKLYAIQLVQPAEEITNPAALVQMRRWEEAAVAWALQGDYARAAELYADQLHQPIRAAQLFDKAGEVLLAARQYEAAGDVKRALDRYRQARAWDKVAALSEQSGDLLAAAQAYEHLERWAKAGKCYYDLGKYAQAVALYEQAARQQRDLGNHEKAKEYLDLAVQKYKDNLNQPAKAVVLLNEFGRKEEAKEILQSIPGWKDEPILRKLFINLVRTPHERAQWYEREGALLPAAREYIAAGEHVRAAELLARSREFALAADEYKAANLPAKAADMMVRMGNWDEAAELYLQAGHSQDALRAYQKAGDNRHAAELFEQLEQWEQAAASWEKLSQWEMAARAWERAGRFVQAAQAWIQEGDAMRAAENYEEAARQQSLTDPNDREAMARLYELAMKQYRTSGMKNKADFCDGRRRYYRKQPAIQVDAIQIGEALRTGEWGKLDVIIANRGWGQAQDIRIQVATQYFELDASRLEKAVGLGMGVQTRYTLWLKPRDAGTVPLHLTVSYHDRRGQPMPEFIYDTDIKVRHSDSKTSTPQVVHVQGDYIQAEQVQKQVGDRVDIRREGRGISLDSEDPATRHSPPATPTITCPYCGLEQPATNSRCENPHCGQPFIQCPSCGLYQPFDKTNQFCIHCGAHL